MSTAFVRQLGAEPGVQLNPLQDDSEIMVADSGDQSFGIVMRATRGRIDRPFKVNRGNVRAKLGKGESIRVSMLNEAWVHVVEALNNGATQAVVQRLVTPAAVLKWATVCVDDQQTITFATSPDAKVPSDIGLLFAVKHLECFNDGIVLQFRADEARHNGLIQPNDQLTLRLLDKDEVLLYEFTGSLNADARDEAGQSAYLPDVVSSQTDAIEVLVGVIGDKAAISPDSAAYGYDAHGRQRWAQSPVLVCFSEGSTAYQTSDYVTACDQLRRTPHAYAYLASGGSVAPAHLAQLAQLAFDTNRQLRFDVPGYLPPEAAVAFVEQLNLGSHPTAHLLHAFWSPLQSDDPTGINPKGYFGVATLNIAYACARNARQNAKGFAPKNYPIAGREYPLNRQRLTQMLTPSHQELDALARAKINPVLYTEYVGGGRYVFTDSLTSALVASSLKKLIAVAEMSTSLDELMTQAGKAALQLPMSVGITRLRRFAQALFEGAEDAGWLTPSLTPEMAGAAWRLDIRPNAQRPYDCIDCAYWLHYDGTVRQIFVTQTLSR
ncbi:hypothetical protein HZU77_015035 [Neisseriaceae bacterium TC5R-5]|nr:hypothetical protein [Neisseriaceae bacterium TC5R-5]